MQNPRIFEDLAHAVFANMSVSEKINVGAKQSVVAQTLNYCNPILSGRVINRRRKQRKEVLNMKYIELIFLQFAVNEIIGLARPKRLNGDLNLSTRLNLRIVDMNRLDRVALGAKHPHFRFVALIFAASELVAIVQHQYLQTEPHLSVRDEVIKLVGQMNRCNTTSNLIL
jgi:hypothetical protein